MGMSYFKIDVEMAREDEDFHARRIRRIAERKAMSEAGFNWPRYAYNEGNDKQKAKAKAQAEKDLALWSVKVPTVNLVILEGFWL